MGPRHKGRGKTVQCLSGSRLRGASMGPRRKGRGKVYEVRVCRPDSSCFNGAASQRTRKAWLRSARTRNMDGFNGAASQRTRKGRHGSQYRASVRRASMGPRRKGRGKRVKQPTTSFLLCLLQWGRVAKDAERKMAMVRLGDAIDASMGPRRKGRGKFAVMLLESLLFTWLQWGRVAKDAERVRECTATLGSAKLQWGRVAKDAERTTTMPRYLKMLSLQWGRVAKDAERMRYGQCIRPTNWLQWGRVAKDAERAARACADPVGSCALKIERFLVYPWCWAEYSRQSHAISFVYK